MSYGDYPGSMSAPFGQASSLVLDASINMPVLSADGVLSLSERDDHDLPTISRDLVASHEAVHEAVQKLKIDLPSKVLELSDRIRSVYGVREDWGQQSQVGIQIPRSLRQVVLASFSGGEEEIQLEPWCSTLLRELWLQETRFRVRTHFDFCSIDNRASSKPMWALYRRFLLLTTVEGERIGLIEQEGACCEVILDGIPFAVQLTSDGLIDMVNARYLFTSLQNHKGTIQIILEE